MKTMTCKQLGGPCDAEIRGNTPDEMMKNGEKHLTEMKDVDRGHKEAYDMMAEMGKNPEESMQWEEDFRLKFNALPED